jgi:hypothetical protein
MRIIQLPWSSFRSAVVADDTALATFDYDSWPSSGSISIRPDCGPSELLDAKRLLIACYGIGDENATSGYKLYGRRINGPILLIATGVLTLGTQVVTKDPITKATSTAKWADTMTITGGLWNDLAPLVIDSAANRIAVLRGRNDGIRDYYFEVDLDAVGSGSYCTSVSAIIAGIEGGE